MEFHHYHQEWKCQCDKCQGCLRKIVIGEAEKRMYFFLACKPSLRIYEHFKKLKAGGIKRRWEKRTSRKKSFQRRAHTQEMSKSVQESVCVWVTFKTTVVSHWISITPVIINTEDCEEEKGQTLSAASVCKLKVSPPLFPLKAMWSWPSSMLSLSPSFLCVHTY